MSQLQMYAAMSYQEARLEGYQRSMSRREGSRARAERARRRQAEATWR